MLTEQKKVLPATGRMEKRRQSTRAKLLNAGYAVMAADGVDASKIKDITDRADVGFGTFYNYFASKDELAGQVLDCVIDDLGRRNVAATRSLAATKPAFVMPVSMRLVRYEATQSPMWRWWALRPDLLSDRMRDGFGPFGRNDLSEAIAAGLTDLHSDEVELAWALAMWTMVGAIHDIVVGRRSIESIGPTVAAIIRLLGFGADAAAEAVAVILPSYAKSKINWNFSLAPDQQ